MVFERRILPRTTTGDKTGLKLSLDDSVRKSLSSAPHAPLRENDDGDSKISAFSEYPSTYYLIHMVKFILLNI